MRQGNRPPPEFRFTEPETWPEPAITTVADTTSYGQAEIQAGLANQRAL